MTNYQQLLDELRDMGIRLRQDDTEFAAFSARVQEKVPRTVVEVGTCDGGSLWILARMLPVETKIISIDLPQGPWGKIGSDEKRKSVAEDLRARGYDVVLIDGNSQLETTRDELNEILEEKEIDLLFIDADHSFRGSLRDWELYSPLVAENGLVAFHDILESESTPKIKVFHVWQVLKTLYKTEEFLGSQAKKSGVFGIGLLQKTAL